MGIEIERKFLVKSEAWRSQGQGTRYCQGYIAKTTDANVRVRIAGELGFLTLKGKAQHYTRPEFEYPIPVADAREMLALWCHPHVVEKIRYRIPIGGHVWEVDEFLGDNQGLVLAEVELRDPDEAIVFPDWLGVEVSHQSQYYNSSLAYHPYSAWTQLEKDSGSDSSGSSPF
ncbi:MAG: CYTH domain-containing protein [Thermosynechococcaceae cyanobacterium]